MSETAGVTDLDAAGFDQLPGSEHAVDLVPESQVPTPAQTAAHYNSAVNHPAHYGGADNPYEAIKIIEAHNLGFHLGNAVKYILRSDHKGATIQDLEKARWYLDRRIAKLKESDG